ncbi:MAG: DUF6323 family protein [Candidatus Ventricola sp.]
MLFPVPRVESAALNKASAPFGLILSPSQIAALQRQEAKALERTGRVCFGKSILPRLAAAFAGSPHIQACDWADTLVELTDLFYALKRETEDSLSDEELIGRMVRTFDGPAQGSTTLLADFFFMPDEPEEDDDEA